jgi:hypothetical protein
LSFFDEADDEPRTESRPISRSGSRGSPRRRPRDRDGGGRRPPSGQQQSIQVRRAIAAGALVVLILLIAIGVNSCEANQTTSDLKDYANGVNALIAKSQQTSSRLFSILSHAGSAGAQTAFSDITDTLPAVKSELSTAQTQNVPSQTATANSKLVLVMRMRVDAVQAIASDIEPALSGSASDRDAITGIAGAMSYLYASDVLYKGYVGPEIAGALHGDSISAGGLINGAQFVPSLQWLSPSFIAGQLQVSSAGLGGTSTKIAPGSHGHELNSVAVAGTTLQTGSTNTLPATPAPTFTLNFTNSGQNIETNVVCEVTVVGTGVSGKATVAQTTPGETTTCQVTLASSPPAGTYNVKATIKPVPGEKVISNNTQTFPVTFN